MSIASTELIVHQQFGQALERAHRVIHRALAGESLMLPIFGPTRVGKSQLVDELVAAYPSQLVDGVRRQPLVRVKVLGRPTRRSLSEAVLMALNTRRYGRASADELMSRVCDLLRVVGTRVLLFEEMQQFVEGMSAKATREASDWLKIMAEELGITLILVGLPITSEIFLRNEQLRDRAERVQEIRPYNWNDPQQQREFQQTLNALLEAYLEAGWLLPVAQDPELLARVYGSCLGRVGMLFKLFVAVEHLARKHVLDFALLARAHEEAIQTDFFQFNPFDQRRTLTHNLLVESYVRVLTEAHMSIPKVRQAEVVA
ncbi:TniB family NTP-binding protein [Pseudomonas sp. NY15181]|uniref:TniB family NTP-binding protein n=1 Tax=Pseudomonas sp. NY15181 TaxID=3400349 RepID=UPI003A8C28B5